MLTRLIIVLQTIAFTFRHWAILAAEVGFEPTSCRSERHLLPEFPQKLVCIAGFDPAAPDARGRCSTRLSYMQMARTRGVEPLSSFLLPLS